MTVPNQFPTVDPGIENHRRRKRYRNDPIYRAKQIANSKRYGRSTRARIKRKIVYWRHPERGRKAARDYYYQFRSVIKPKAAAWRERNRKVLRAKARRESDLLTDSYVRNQLSKYSSKSTWGWTEKEVAARRTQMIRNRLKRVDAAKALAIRQRAASREVIARQYGISPSLVYMILRNQIHVDTNYVPIRPIRNWEATTRFFRMVAGAAEIAKANEQLTTV